MKKHTEILKHMLTDDELIEAARKQSGLLRDKAELERQLASVRSDFKARLERIDSEVGVCTRHISDGFDMRPVDCQTIYHTPREGWKTTIRMDLMERVSEMRMSDAECQKELPFEEPEPEPEQVEMTVAVVDAEETAAPATDEPKTKGDK